MTPVRKVIFLSTDVLCMVFSLTAAIWLRFEGFEPHHFHNLLLIFPVAIPGSLVIFWTLGLYNRTLRFTSIPDMMAVFNAVTIGSMLKMAYLYLNINLEYSRSILILDWMMNLLLIGSSRIAPRIFLNLVETEPVRRILLGKDDSRLRRVLIFGAGRAGESVVREIQRNENLRYEVVGFLDDEPEKLGQIIHGCKVLGNRSILNQVIAVKKVEEIIIAIPSASGEVLREIVKLCRDTRIRFKTLPGLQDLIDGRLVSLQIRDIAIEDLLRRAPTEINLAEIAAYITGKNVLITGAGGSIGSEICRQILPFRPSKLILLGHGETSIFNILNELMKDPQVTANQLVPLIADIQDINKLRSIFIAHQPQIVFHAAAHKHVPLMEANPDESVKNNILGTQNLVSVSHDAGIERFVMISTDKAVNPTSVMGATKRVAELVLKAYAKRSPTRFTAVRFGNVLGSRGSVIPIFKRQIEEGGPITITHPNMIRYFMTIPEASKLVIQAGAFGKGGEVFVLDMGEPVKIVDLASDLLRLAGLEAGRDIQIVFTGIRPGEKMYEEILTAEEGITATRNRKIFVAKPEEVDEEALLANLATLFHSAENSNSRRIIETLRSLIPSFSPNRDHIFNEPKFKNVSPPSRKDKNKHLQVV